MFSKTLLTAAALFAATLVRADPSPSAPGPGDVFNQGSDCKIEWTPDTTGVWTTMNIELMTGANLDMKHLTTVTTVDGTKASSYTFTCPAVVPNSAIYFYQFTSPASNVTLWTTRFGIASADGHLDPPAESTQPGSNQAIPWGNGALADPSSATPPPSKSGSSASGSAAVSGNVGPSGSAIASGSASASSAASSASASGFSTSASAPLGTASVTAGGASAKSSGSASPASSSAVPSSGAAAANGASGISVGSSGVKGAVVALVGVAVAFGVMA